MTEDEKRVRHARLRAEELAGEVERWCWLSFVDDGVFQGAVLLKAHGPVTAVEETWRKGINPGGEVRVVVADDGWTPRVDGYADRLLTRDEAEAFDAAYEAAGRRSV